jgi:hypothetical protein
MPENISHKQKGQDERAQRIRQQIERLKSGESTEDASDSAKSLKEQIGEREKQSEAKPDPDHK